MQGSCELYFTSQDYIRVLCAGQLWPHVSMAATGLVGDQLNPQLAMNKPKWISDIHLHNFNLGDEPPSISGVKVSLLCLTVYTLYVHLPRLKLSIPIPNKQIQTLT